MPEWKKMIFVNAIRSRIKIENRTAEDIINDYPKLTVEEKIEILNELHQSMKQYFQLKTIDDVPTRWRETVQELLDADAQQDTNDV